MDDYTLRLNRWLPSAQNCLGCWPLKADPKAIWIGQTVARGSLLHDLKADQVTVKCERPRHVKHLEERGQAFEFWNHIREGSMSSARGQGPTVNL